MKAVIMFPLNLLNLQTKQTCMTQFFLVLLINPNPLYLFVTCLWILPTFSTTLSGHRTQN